MDAPTTSIEQEAAAKKTMARVGALLFGLVTFIGVVCVFETVHEQTPEDHEYEGIFNGANYFIILLSAQAIVFALMLYTKAGMFPSHKYTYTGLGYMIYPIAGLGTFIMTGAIEPSVSRLSWVNALSFANLNTVRIGWESSKDYNETYSVFERSDTLKDYGLVNKWTIIDITEDDITRDDYRTGFVGLLMVAIGLFGLVFLTAGDAFGVPFKGEFLKAAKIDAAASTGAFLAVFSAFLGLAACVVAFTTDAAADPTHPFYEAVIGIAAYSVAGSMCFGTGYMTESQPWIEVGLFLAGFFSLSGPVKLFQLKSFAELDVVKSEMVGNSYVDSNANPTESIISAEIDRYTVVVVLGVLQALFGILAAISFRRLYSTRDGLDEHITETKAMDGVSYGYAEVRTEGDDGAETVTIVKLPQFKKDVLHYVLILTSFILVLAGVALEFRVIDESLDAIGEDMNLTYRADAANFYTFLLLVAWFCMAVQYFDASLASLKPLWFVAVGIYISVFTGFSNIGTHDRQLFMVDHSMAGINELRAFHQGDDDDFKERKALDVDEDIIEQAQAAQLCYILGIFIVYFASVKIPLNKFCGTTHWEKEREFAYAGNKKVVVLTLAAFVCFIVSAALLTSTTLAEPAIHSAAKSSFAANSTKSDCQGDYFNLIASPAEQGCFSASDASNYTWAGVINSERLTLNVLTSWVPTDRKYAEIFTFVALSLCTACGSFTGVFSADARSVRTSLYLAGVLTLAPIYALTWDVDKNNEIAGYNRRYNKNSEYDEMQADYGCSDNSKCIAYKTGFAFLFFQAILTIVAMTTAAAQLSDTITKKAPAVRKEDHDVKDDLKNLYLTKTPEEQQKIVEVLREQGLITEDSGYLQVAPEAESQVDVM